MNNSVFLPVSAHIWSKICLSQSLGNQRVNNKKKRDENRLQISKNLVK